MSRMYHQKQCCCSNSQSDAFMDKLGLKSEIFTTAHNRIVMFQKTSLEFTAGKLHFSHIKFCAHFLIGTVDKE